MVKIAVLVLRLFEVVLCLISISVLASDKTLGRSGDSFYHYKEYMHCLSVNAIACLYSGYQVLELAYYLVTEKDVIHQHHLRRLFDFFMDQVLAYLLISASSSAATRVDDWQSNWGKDVRASVSVAMAFLAFIAFAITSFISGYNLFTVDSPSFLSQLGTSIFGPVDEALSRDSKS